MSKFAQCRIVQKLLSLRVGIFALLGAVVVGAILLGGFNSVLGWTNTESFCVTCHEMRDNVYAEYRGTIHDKNRTGVRATCPDCHVPREIVPKLIRKVQAAGELWAKFTGKLDTREKFQEHRYELAKHVWTTMKKTDSQACRNCHDANSMSSKKQSEKAQARHEKMRREGMTCIDCHYAIAHEEPEGELGPQDIVVAK
ncbi:MAG: NapC/NirT family cytochrome c [Magnetospirillum sp.]|nr:NapC/NirT family cytochrome c [Magnetospirillum sp.]